MASSSSLLVTFNTTFSRTHSFQEIGFVWFWFCAFTSLLGFSSCADKVFLSATCFACCLSLWLAWRYNQLSIFCYWRLFQRCGETSRPLLYWWFRWSTDSTCNRGTKKECLGKRLKKRDPPKSCSYGLDLLPGQVQVGARCCKLTFSNTISSDETKLAIDDTLFRGGFRWKPKMARRVDRVGRVGGPGLRCKGGGCCCGCSSRLSGNPKGSKFWEAPTSEGCPFWLHV